MALPRPQNLSRDLALRLRAAIREPDELRLAEWLQLGEGWADWRVEVTQPQDRLFAGDLPSQPVVRSSPWRLSDIHQNEKHVVMRSMIEANGDPRRCAVFRTRCERVSNGAVLIDNALPIASPEALRWHFGYCRDLALSIASDGLLRLDDGVSDAGVREISPGVAIGSGGELHWVGEGMHRSAVVLALGISPVPVTVRIINADWLRSMIQVGSLDGALNRRRVEFNTEEPVDTSRAQRWSAGVDRSIEFPALPPDEGGWNATLVDVTRLQNLGWVDDAVALWESRAHVDKPLHIEVLHAETLRRAGDHEGAERMARGVLSVQRNHAEALRVLGRTSIDCGERRAALSYFNTLVRVDGHVAAELRTHIELATEFGAAVEARDSLVRLAELRPDDERLLERLRLQIDTASVTG